MSTDFQMVTTVKREFARRLPFDLVTLVLEFANWMNEEQKRACITDFETFVQQHRIQPNFPWEHGRPCQQLRPSRLWMKDEHINPSWIWRVPQDDEDILYCSRDQWFRDRART